ncbi:cell division protein FtsZ [Candidatus Shapirobacteria bacterium]|nr:cell division protein FtsZ [Candidatus Shapirobacteria bacterium]
MGLIKPLPAQIAKIKVVGVGGGGGNTVNYMSSQEQINGVDLVAVNTDAQALLASQAKIKIQIGEKLTRGLGAGGNPQIGQQAAEESKEKIKEVLEGTDMVFITGGLGGGSCSGGAPAIAQVAKEELGALTIAVVTKPFLFEGTRRMVIAEEALNNLRDKVDALIVIPNQRLLELGDENLSFLEAFRLADSVLSQAVAGIAELITTSGLINIDFADLRSVVQNAGTAVMGVGVASGENRAEEAIKAAVSSPLLDARIEGARGVLFNVTGGLDLSIKEVEKIAQTITQSIGGDANVIFGAAIDEKLKDQIKITLIATGFDPQRKTLNGLIKKTEPKSVLKKVSSEERDKLVRMDLPEGIEIETELDIPSFLRRGSN